MKARITYTAWIEVELNPDNYPNCNSDEERLNQDLQQMQEDPDAFLEVHSTQDASQFKVTGVLIK